MKIQLSHYLLIFMLVTMEFKVSGKELIPIYNTCGGIQLAVNKAQIGDTIRLRPVKYTISKTIDIESGITIMGSGPERTILYHTDKRHDEFWIFKVDGSNQKPLRMSGFTIIGKSPEVSSGILIVKNCKNFRIDHCYFKNCSRRAIEIHGDSRGVIDHSEFRNNWYTSIVVYGSGEDDWNRNFTLGDSNAVFVENNYFVQDSVPDMSIAHHIASNNGSHYVFRYNTIRDGKIASHAIDAHGNKFGSERGSRSYEIYKNKIFAAHRWAGINIRGGDGVIYNNEFTGDYISPIHLMQEGREGDGKCKYPCLDQIRQLYIWNNSYNGKPVKVYSRYPQLIQINRDYFLQKKTGYIPFTYPHPATN